jgi:hypothetical protein
MINKRLWALCLSKYTKIIIKLYHALEKHGMYDIYTSIDNKKSDNLIWVIIDTYNNSPIIVASSKEKAEQQLFDYMGWKNPIHEETVRYLGFTPIEYSEHEDDYVGFYKFESLVPQGHNKEHEWETDLFQLHCKILDASQK